MTELEDLQLFLRIAEADSLSEVATRQRISLSTVSRRLAALEERLGAQLVRRSARHLELTDAGLRYRTGLAPLLRQLEDLEEDIVKEEARLAGPLKVTAAVVFGEQLLTGWLLELKRTYPGLELELVWSDEHLDLEAHDIDLAVRMGNLSDSSLVARRLGTLSHRLVATPSLVKDCGGPPRSLEELERFPIVEYTGLRRPGMLESSFEGKVTRLPFAGTVRINHAGAMLEAVRLGAGIAICPSYMVEADLVSGELQALLPNLQLPEFPIHAVFAAHRKGRARVRRAVEHLVERFAAAGPAFGGEPVRSASRGRSGRSA